MATFEAGARIHGVVVVTPDVFADERGLFVETYRRAWFPEGREMLQANRSDRQAGAVVGLHVHLHQADYWYVSVGRARVVLHDLRTGSPTERATQDLDIGDHDHRGVWIPPGVAHGFSALTALTMNYLVDQYYNSADELGVAWDDPEIAGDWGVDGSRPPVLSERDLANPLRSELAACGRLPAFGLRT